MTRGTSTLHCESRGEHEPLVAGSLAGRALCASRPFLETRPCACIALDDWRYIDSFPRSLASLQK